MQAKESANRLIRIHIIYESERREKKGPANQLTRFHTIYENESIGKKI